MAISVINCPSELHKDFINEFSVFLGAVISNFDRLLLLGDIINVHVCCPANSFVKEYLSLIDSY